MDLRRYKARCRKEELERWGEQLAQGKSVKSFADDKIGNAFLYEPCLLKHCRFITALQIRTNTGGNRSSLNRAVPHKKPAMQEMPRTERDVGAHTVPINVFILMAPE
jgi:hypothetical protein